MIVSREYNGIRYYADLFDFGLPTSKIEAYLDGLHPSELALMKEFIEADGVVQFLGGDNTLAAGFGTYRESGVEIPAVTINLNARRSMAGAFFHEYIHYTQWRRGDLTFTYSADGRVKQMFWKGEVAATHDQTDAREYLDQPWEEEAHLAEYSYLYRTGQSRMSVRTAMVARRANLWVDGTITALARKFTR